ncbi:TspO/MBR family protein [Ornithinimicrobium tianjinense]|uniref:Tryptophan-rich sensory protein n=1 Tax=Ornithinimicrobium tianjinense TaxID=1195761 RepID=A0A917BTG1_9MICO|nr:TspO/MBR family protein [Ornithinimicrobium tianjinense]GGF53821.1 tryptophan-rich sensory protein [Ornithinimicrobium tianjinense]
MSSDVRRPSSLRRDQVIVTVSAVVWVLGTLVGTGLVGDAGGVEEQGEGLFTDSTTLIAPHGPAFAIWSVIYLFLAAYVLWQWLPRAEGSRWAARSRLPAAASLALNGIWLLVVRAGWVTVSVLVIAGIAVSLGLVLARTAQLPDEGWESGLLVGVTYGLYLGWICVATCANVALWLVGLGVPEDGLGPTVVTLVVLAVVVALVAVLLARTPHRTFQAALVAAVVWGLAWVSVGRFVGDLRNDAVGYAAALAVVLVAAFGGRALARPRHTAVVRRA